MESHSFFAAKQSAQHVLFPRAWTVPKGAEALVSSVGAIVFSAAFGEEIEKPAAGAMRASMYFCVARAVCVWLL